MKKYLFIDIRKSDEVYKKRFDNSKDYSFYNIPMNMIRFNIKNIISHLDYYTEIYIICQSGNRSSFIKDKYFKEYEKIKVNNEFQFYNLNYGNNKILLDNDLNINIIGNNSFNLYNDMRIIQIIMGTIMLSMGLSIYFQLPDLSNIIINIAIIILIIFGSMGLYNGISSTCSMSILLRDYLN